MASTLILHMGLTAEPASICCFVLDWVVGETNLPDSKDFTQLTSSHSVPLTPGGGQLSASTALVGVVHIAPVIPKQASL